jgi:hypothetical protein
MTSKKDDKLLKIAEMFPPIREDLERYQKATEKGKIKLLKEWEAEKKN